MFRFNSDITLTFGGIEYCWYKPDEKLELLERMSKASEFFKGGNGTIETIEYLNYILDNENAVEEIFTELSADITTERLMDIFDYIVEAVSRASTVTGKRGNMIDEEAENANL